MRADKISIQELQVPTQRQYKVSVVEWEWIEIVYLILQFVYISIDLFYVIIDYVVEFILKFFNGVRADRVEFQ